MRTVFLSSVGRDLNEHRKAVYAAIEGLKGYHCVRMEDFGAWDTQADSFCRAEVGKCDLFVCLAGPLYGSITPAGPSYTEREFDAAEEHTKHCLVFLTVEDYPLPVNLTESDDTRKRQQVFRERISKGRMIERFSKPDELATHVVQAIRNWENSLLGDRPQLASRLRIRLEGAASKTVESSDPFVSIGRGSQSVFRLDDPEASWDHGQIVFERGAYHYRQLSRTNPTIIIRRGEEIRIEPGQAAAVPLQTQDRIQIGNATLAVDFDLVDVDEEYVPTSKRPRKQSE